MKFYQNSFNEFVFCVYIYVHVVFWNNELWVRYTIFTIILFFFAVFCVTVLVVVCLLRLILPHNISHIHSLRVICTMYDVSVLCAQAKYKVFTSNNIQICEYISWGLYCISQQILFVASTKSRVYFAVHFVSQIMLQEHQWVRVKSFKRPYVLHILVFLISKRKDFICPKFYSSAVQSLNLFI